MMRVKLAIASLLVLQGCGGGNPLGNAASGFSQGFDDGFRKSFRSKFIEQCDAGAKQSSGKAIDFTPVCTCVADGFMKGKTVSQLTAGPTDAEEQELSKRCIAEHPIT